MKIAFVYDRVNKIGGAERVLTALHEIWPDAPLYTAVYDPNQAPWAAKFHVIPTFMQSIPFAKNHHEWFAWLTPFAFGSLSFDAYDVVISVTSAEAKSIVTKPNTLHICYCLTPTRYLWSSADVYKEQTGFGYFHGIVKWIFSLVLPTLQRWDHVAGMRPDQMIAISQRVKDRIGTYYQRTVDAVIYPPVDTEIFQPAKQEATSSPYYLTVSRLVPYKRVDIVVSACTHLHKPLIVIGSGSDKKRLQAMAGPTIRFIDGNLTDQALVGYHQDCRAFLFSGDEDFGIVAGEAQACGKPVLCYKHSGMAEIVIDGQTGIMFDSQTSKSLEDAIIAFEQKNIFKSTFIRKNALRFGKQTFKKEMKQFVEQSYKKYLSTL